MAETDAMAANGGLAGLMELHRGELLRFLAARCGDRSEAEDLLQELWLKAAQTATGPIGNGRAYLFRMANNLVLDRLRDWLERDGGVAQAAEERRDPTPGAEAGLIDAEEVDLLRHAIGSLPDGARRALLLYRFEGHGQAEIARIMGISRSGVEKHLAVAMRHLRQRLVDCGFLAAAPSHGEKPARGAAPDGKTKP
jgi:RNA polymerase sigma factor (sigma-70 family)